MFKVPEREILWESLSSVALEERTQVAVFPDWILTVGLPHPTRIFIFEMVENGTPEL